MVTKIFQELIKINFNLLELYEHMHTTKTTVYAPAGRHLGRKKYLEKALLSKTKASAQWGTYTLTSVIS